MFESRFGSRSRRSAGRANKELLEEAFGPSRRGNEERERRIKFQPTFIGGRQALWGRGDFFAAFHVSFDEPGRSFEVTPH
jgi:hypothetical protein